MLVQRVHIYIYIYFFFFLHMIGLRKISHGVHIVVITLWHEIITLISFFIIIIFFWHDLDLNLLLATVNFNSLLTPTHRIG